MQVVVLKKTLQLEALCAIYHSGPMYIAIRSDRHDSSTSFTHGADGHNLVNLLSFKDVARTTFGEVKPIMFVFCDVGPDENTRFPKVLQNAIEHILKTLIWMHIYAYNFVESPFGPLSNEFGTHLNEKGGTIDIDLEKKNLYALIIDGFPVDAEYMIGNTITPDVIDERWAFQHCRVSQYNSKL